MKFEIISIEGEDYITIKEQIYDGYITSIKMNASKSYHAILYFEMEREAYIHAMLLNFST